jgi:hypothetical protein
MPRIPTVNPEKKLAIASQPTMPGSFGTAPGRAMQRLGGAIAGFGNALEQGAEVENQEQEYNNKLETLKWENENAKTYAEREANYNPDVHDPNEWEQKQAEWYQKRQQELRSRVRPSTTKSQQRLELYLERNRGQYQNRTTQFAIKQRRTKLVNSVTGAITGEFGKLDPSDPETFDQHFDTSLKSVETIIDQAPLPDNVKDALRRKGADLALAMLTAKLPAGARLPVIQKRLEQWKAELSGKTPASDVHGDRPVNEGGESVTVDEDGQEVREPNLVAGPKPALQDKLPWQIYDKKVPSSAQRKAIQRNGGVVVNLDTNWSKSGSQTSPMVVIPDDATPEQRQAAEAYAARIAEVYEKQFGKSLAPRVITRSENGRGRAATIHTEPYAVTDAKAVEFFGSAEGSRLHAQILRETLGKIPGVHFSMPHNEAKGDRGAHGSRTNEVKLARMVIENLKVASEQEPSENTVRSSIRSYMMQNLTQRMPAIMQQHRAAIAAQVKGLRDNAAKGYELPPEQLESLKGVVAATKDPQLIAEYESAVGFSKLTGALTRQTPALNEQYLSDIRERFAKKSPTPSQLKTLELTERLVAEQKTALKKDALKWAARAGVGDLQPLDIANADSMKMRHELAKATAAQYGIQPQYFTDEERTSITKAIEAGDLPISALAQSMVANWGPQEARVALGEISDKSPSAALLGGHLVTVGATQVAADAEAGLQLMREPKYKPLPTPIAEVRGAMRDTLGTVIDHLPKTQEALRDLAAAAYEARGRKKGVTEFDPKLYGEVVRELVGERDVDGIKYGGIANSERGYLWGGSNPVVVPPDVRQDGIDELKDELTVEMLPEVPKTPTGKPITTAELRDVRLVTISAGRYYITSNDGDPDEDMAPDKVYRNSEGQPYVLEFDTVRDKLKALRDDLFLSD